MAVVSFSCGAVLFDLDGVLVDSNAVIERHWRAWAAETGVDLEAILRLARRSSRASSLNVILRASVRAMRAQVAKDGPQDDVNETVSARIAVPRRASPRDHPLRSRTRGREPRKRATCTASPGARVPWRLGALVPDLLVTDHRSLITHPCDLVLDALS
ncbi:MAG: hypothetical protein A2Z66_02475 [Chloroflexi bacterium RBG_13_66_10]|nr:MAG: hypothetical protein A2Z66_02475 [Chloroflexi bacterium RBG_13_66_10]